MKLACRCASFYQRLFLLMEARSLVTWICAARQICPITLRSRPRIFITSRSTRQGRHFSHTPHHYHHRSSSTSTSGRSSLQRNNLPPRFKRPENRFKRNPSPKAPPNGRAGQSSLVAAEDTTPET